MRYSYAILIVLLSCHSALATPLQGVDVRAGVMDRGHEWARLTGTEPPLVGDTVDATTWAQLEGSVTGTGLSALMVKHKPGSGDPPNALWSPYVLELELPMFPAQDTGGTAFSAISNRLSLGAAGNYNSHWTTVATALVARGLGGSHIRLGKEFNIPTAYGGLWAIGGASTATKQDYATYWRAVHDAMMAVPGANFKWTWSVLMGQDSAAEFTSLTTYAYPGNSYVDYVGADVYDSSGYSGYWKFHWQETSGSIWANQFSDTQIQDLTWEELSTGVHRNGSGTLVSDDAGLNDYKSFADSKSKGFVISECGIVEQDRAIPSVADNPGLFSYGNNDDPAFITRLYSWAAANSIYGLIYREYCVQRHNSAYENTPTIVDQALLPGFWRTATGAAGNPLQPEQLPHPRSSKAMELATRTGGGAPASQMIPAPWKYTGSLEIPYTDADGAFQPGAGGVPVAYASCPTIVKGFVTGSVGNWKGIAVLGLAAETGYAFEAYCGSSGVPDVSAGGAVFRVMKNGTSIWSTSRKPISGSMAYSGANWTTTPEEMAVVVTNEAGGRRRIKVTFGPDVIGEFSDSYGLTGRVDGATYNGQTLNGARQTAGEVKTSWLYQENFDDGDADGFTLSGWTLARTQLNAAVTSGDKTATRGAFTDTNYTVACQMALNTAGKSAGVSVLTDSSGNGYRVELKSKNVTTGAVTERNLLDTILIRRTGGSTTVLATYTVTDKVFMGELQDLEIATKDLSDLNLKERLRVSLNGIQVLDYTDLVAVSRAGKSGVWAESLGGAWMDNYVLVGTVPEYPLIGLNVNPTFLERAAAWGPWAGYTPEIIGDNCFSGTWAELAGSVAGAGMDYAIRKYSPGPGDPANPIAGISYELELAVPMFPDRDKSGVDFKTISARFDNGVAGNYDSYWTTLATNLVAKGMGDTHIRLGWEFNIPYYNNSNSWSVGQGTTAMKQSYAAYWRRIHDLMMAVPGASFSWSWSVLVGEGDLTEFDSLFTYAYPGDAYVDYISADAYDSSNNAGYYKSRWQDPAFGTPGVWSNQISDTQIVDRTWEEVLTGVYRFNNGTINQTQPGLQGFKVFADTHGKKFVISEAGILEQERCIPASMKDNGLINAGNNDDPDFIQRLYTWADQNEIYGLVYFEFALNRNYTSYGSTPTTTDHSLLGGYWNTLTGAHENPLYPLVQPHSRAAATLIQYLGGSGGVPAARKYVGSLEIPSMGDDSLFLTTNGATAVTLASCPTVVKGDVTGVSGSWKGISFLGTSSQVGYAFEGYCGANNNPSPSPSNGPIWRVTKNGTVVWSSSRPLLVGPVPMQGKTWTLNAQEMAVVVTNEYSSSRRIKLLFGPDTVGEFSDSYGLTGRVDGATYNGQTLNGVRSATAQVKSSWFYQENFDDGDADGFTLSGWAPLRAALYADATTGDKTATRGSYTDSAYTVACQIGLNTTGKSAGVNVLTASSGNGYRVQLKSKDITGGYQEKGLLDTITLKRTGGSSTVLATFATATGEKRYMEQLQDLKVVTSVPAGSPSSILVKVYLNGTLVISYTDGAPTSTAGKSGVWSESGGGAWIDNYVQLPSI